MKRIRILAALCILLFLFSGCDRRKAIKQLQSSDFLHANGTDIVNVSGEKVSLSLQTVTVGQQSPEKVKERISAISDDVMLRLGEQEIDISGEWKLSERGKNMISTALASLSKGKYCVIGWQEYPDSFSAWYEDSDFEDGVISLWTDVAVFCKDEKTVAAFAVDNLPFPGASESESALTIFQTFLQRVSDGIRSVDAEHMLLIGTVSSALDVVEYNGFPYIKDANFSYITKPDRLEYYCKQQAKNETPPHLCYPNEYWTGIEGLEIRKMIIGSDIDFSSIDYQTRATEVFEVEDEGLFCRLGAFVMPENSDGGGEARILSVKFAECDDDGEELKTICDIPSSVGIPFTVADAAGVESDGSVYEDGTAYLESILDESHFYVSNLNIPLQKGKKYQLTVTMKQRGMNKRFRCAPAVFTFGCKNHAVLDKSYLSQYFGSLFTEAKTVGVPLIYDDILPVQTGADIGADAFYKDAVSVITELGQHYTFEK